MAAPVTINTKETNPNEILNPLNKKQKPPNILKPPNEILKPLKCGILAEMSNL